MSPYGRSKLMTEMMLADAAAAHRLPLCGAALLQRRRRRSRRAAPASRRRGATHLIKVACEAALGQRDGIDRLRHRLPDRRTAPACATISMSAISSRRMPRARAICAPAARASSPNCGYGRGFSVLEVIDTVKRVSGTDFAGRARRAPPRRPCRRSSPSPACITATLGWQPRYDDLDAIVARCARLGGCALPPQSARLSPSTAGVPSSPYWRRRRCSSR